MRSSSIMNVFLLSIVAGLLLCPIVSYAELYKWIDEQGLSTLLMHRLPVRTRNPI